MTDTLDTNLPQKPVELEEEQQSAEVAEPVATETSAEENTTEQSVETAQKLSKEEILAKLKEIATHVEEAPKADIDSLKQAFYKLHNAEQEADSLKTEALPKTLFPPLTLRKKNSRMSCPSSKKSGANWPPNRKSNGK